MHLPTDPAALAALRPPTAQHPWRVLVSGCMAGMACGVVGDDNGMMAHQTLQAFLHHPFVQTVAYCPEMVAIGVPRGMPDIHGGDGFDVLQGRARVLVDSKEDVTDALVAAADVMATLGETCDLAVLVDISATCGSQAISLGDRQAPDRQYQNNPALVAARLWSHRIPFTSHRDALTLARLMQRLEGTAPAPELFDHHDHPWMREHFPEGPWSLGTRALEMRSQRSTRRPVTKILSRAQWEARAAVVPWAEIDHQDGFMHLSSADQVEETLRLHFAGRDDLVRVEIDPAQIPCLIWEPSRGGQLFPHAYGEVPLSAVVG